MHILTRQEEALSISVQPVGAVYAESTAFCDLLSGLALWDTV